MLGRYGDAAQNTSTSRNTISIINGRIFTPGLAILDSPQPNTPMGGDFLHVALDVSGDGALPFPPSSNPSAATRLHNITLFLTSTSMDKNFTISNGTSNMAPLTNILDQEEGSTVKHVNFEWPLCLVGDGKDAQGTARGAYNVSIHQSFRLNGSDFYTIFNLPLSITNKIEQFPSAVQLLTNPRPGPLSENGGRMPCEMLENRLLKDDELLASVRNPGSQPFDGAGKLEVVNVNNNGGGGQIGGPGGSSGSSGNQSPALGAGTVLGVDVMWPLVSMALLMWM